MNSAALARRIAKVAFWAAAALLTASSGLLRPEWAESAERQARAAAERPVTLAAVLDWGSAHAPAVLEARRQYQLALAEYQAATAAVGLKASASLAASQAGQEPLGPSAFLTPALQASLQLPWGLQLKGSASTGVATGTLLSTAAPGGMPDSGGPGGGLGTSTPAPSALGPLAAGSQRSVSTALELKLEYPLFQAAPGRDLERAQRSLTLAESARAEAENQALVEIVGRFFALQRARDQLALAQEETSLRQQAYEVAQKRYQQGAGPYSDVVQAQEQWRAAEQDQYLAEKTALAAARDLADAAGLRTAGSDLGSPLALLSLPLDSGLPLPAGWEQELAPLARIASGTDPDLLAQICQRQSAWQSAKLRESHTQADLDTSRNPWFGSLFASASATDPDGPGAGAPLQTGWSVGAVVGRTLSDPVQAAQTERARLALEKAKADREALEEQILAKVQTAQDDLDLALRQEESARAALARADESARSASARLKAGLVTDLDVRWAALNVKKAQAALAAASRAVVLARLRAGSALGIRWPFAVTQAVR